MATYTYTARLTDFGQQPFPDAHPNLFVVPSVDAFGPTGLLAAKRIPVTFYDPNGAFTVDLVASADTSPAVTYTLVCEWLDVAGSPLGFAEWRFIAVPGGGPIKDMVNAPVSVWWVGPPWPANLPSGFYFDLATGDVGRRD